MKHLKKLSKEEELVYSKLRKVHYSQHEKITRWWCVHCDIKKIEEKQTRGETRLFRKLVRFIGEIIEGAEPTCKNCGREIKWFGRKPYDCICKL